MKGPLVSILVPAYNAAATLSESLASALSQTWPHTEIIVVDDGSQDHSVAVARAFEGPRVRIIRQSHQGAAAARNTALEASRGEFIQWLDADDVLGSEKVAEQLAALI